MLDLLLIDEIEDDVGCHLHDEGNAREDEWDVKLVCPTVAHHKPIYEELLLSNE